MDAVRPLPAVGVGCGTVERSRSCANMFSGRASLTRFNTALDRCNVRCGSIAVVQREVESFAKGRAHNSEEESACPIRQYIPQVILVRYRPEAIVLSTRAYWVKADSRVPRYFSDLDWGFLHRFRVNIRSTLNHHIIIRLDNHIRHIVR